MRTRVLPLGTAFVLRTTMPVQADRPVPDHPAYRQFPTDLQRRHPSPMPAVGGLNIHPARSRQRLRTNRLPHTGCYRGLGGPTTLPAGGESCDCCSPLLPPHWSSSPPNRRRLIGIGIGTGTAAARPIISRIFSRLVAGVTGGPAFRWERSSASDARLGVSSGIATPCRGTGGTHRDGIRRRASISGLRDADRRSKRCYLYSMYKHA
jgi:hypothetical protein